MCHNYDVCKRLHGGRVLAVLKADAYGHGAVQCARALESRADGFAVAFLDEALQLRAAGVTRPILLLEGVFETQELAQVKLHDLWIVVHQETQIRMIEEGSATNINVWLKVDSGMARAGFAPESVAEAHAHLVATGKVAQITLMTHFSCADEADSSTTARQIEITDVATMGIPGNRSFCNSAALMAWPLARREWARAGIALYGADPLPGGDHGLRPVMTLESEVFNVRALELGDRLGYGGGFVADRSMRIGLVALGYADGYPRIAPSGTPVSIDGRLSRVIGRVSMDMLTVDLTDLPDCGIGSKVEMWGAHVNVNDIARAAGTLSYELLCHVKRVPRIYEHPAT